MADDAAERTHDDELTYTVADHVATITLNRPERMNTISGPMLDQLVEHVSAVGR